MKLFSRLRSLWRGVRRRDAVEDDMQAEFRLHLELRAQDLERTGLTPAAARRQARLEFGSLEDHKHHARGSRGLWRVDGLRWSWIDIKLGARMLVKYPGLTLVGGVGLAIAIAIAAATFTISDRTLDPWLPLDQGDRVVAVQSLNLANGEKQTHVHDFDLWRLRVPAISEWAAYRTVDRNLISGGRAEPVRVAEMTASGFRVARVSPLFGRYLVDDDEGAAAALVAVLGYPLWQSRFAADPGAIGQVIQLSGVAHTVVGVMPEGFGFPINNRIWTPLRVRAAEIPHGQGPPLEVFGRLAPGATMAIAQAQLDVVGDQIAAAQPETDRQLRPTAIAYARSFLEGPEAVFALKALQVAITMLLVVIGTNVGVLVYARTATRIGEITLRTALGASRARVITQFFAEALVLSALSAAAGLAVARFALARLDEFLVTFGGEQLPFWMRFGIGWKTVAYVAGLAILAAIIVGVMPALKATGRGVQAGLKHLGSGGSGIRLGRLWTFMIVAQVTVTVALMPTVVGGGIAWLRWTLSQQTFPTSEFATGLLLLDRDAPADLDRAQARARDERYLALVRDLVARVQQAPDVTAVVRTSDVPGDEPVRQFELDRVGARGGTEAPSGVGRVAINFFSVFEVPVLAGRTFDSREMRADATAVVVNEAFVYKNLGPGNAIGRRIRPAASRDGAPQPWLEIVGVVANFPAAIDAKYVAPRMYAPLPDDASPVTLTVRTRGADIAALTGTLRALAADVDPALRLAHLQAFDDALVQQQVILKTMLLASLLISGSALLLSTAGIYALVSLTVTRRRREIAVRLALGAESRRLLASLMSRTLVQISVGIAVGIGVALLLNTLDWTGVVVVGAFMFLVGVAASIGPARRGLRIQPTEALKAE